MARKSVKSLKDLESLYMAGENPQGFTAETVNGTAHWNGTGWNRQPDEPKMPQAKTGGAWQGKRSTRTGE